ncbi:MAG: acetylglutamate kinase [Actinobacteria bacterium]|nr:acetylglutamate kinase [Cyanobacteriota bacterium]MCL5772238.1 acetylglutamate kinase [Actinomycetota bacterium]
MSKDLIEYYNGIEKSIEDIYKNKAQILLEALPYIKEYFNKIVVVKLGGTIMDDDKSLMRVLDDLILMKYVGINVIVIHGGGKQITKLMEEKNIKVEFCDGMRITSKDAIDVVKMVLLGEVNSKIVSFLNRHGEIAVGLSGNDANFVNCKKKIYKKDNKEIDLGYVGEIVKINIDFLLNVLSNGYIPVIATLGSDNKGNIYNINADTFACEIASKFKAKKMILLTDVDGIKIMINSSEKLISKISVSKCRKLIETKDINKGMVPKVNACIDALMNGVERTHILNGNAEHSILIEIFTDKGIGTMIVKE